MNKSLKNILITIFVMVLVNFFLTKIGFLQNSKSANGTFNQSQLEAENSKSQLMLKDDNSRLEETEILNSERENAITTAIVRIQSAVVSVNVIKTQLVRRNYPGSFFFDNFFRGYGPQISKREVKSLGSGVIISKDGYVVTNHHVVEGASKIKLILSNEEEFDAELIGSDEVNDIAILKIKNPQKDIPHAKFGNSDDIIIGEWTIAMGNPFGFIIKDAHPSVTVGVVSAINRNFHQDSKVYKRMIQTDAAINPGNSGGPLFNINGEVIGINTFIFTKSGGSLGIGFAIPINRVKEIANEIKEHGKIRPIWFGFRVQDISAYLANRLKLKTTDGVIVTQVEKGSPADRSKLKSGDLIIRINDQKIENTNEAEIAVADINVGEYISLDVIRDGKEQTIKIQAKEFKKRRNSFFKL